MEELTNTLEKPIATAVAAVSVREMKPSDALPVARLHVEAFPGFFLSLLGASFLRQFYLGLATDRYGLALVAETERGILGFVAGSLQPAGSYRRLLVSRFAGFALFAGIAVLRKPAIAARLLRSVAGRTASEVADGTAELMSIAVDPQAQGQSIGSILIAAFLERAALAGAKRVSLTTDRDNNAGVNSFYLRHGFRLSGSFCTREGRHMNEYIYDLGVDIKPISRIRCVESKQIDKQYT